MTHARTAGFTIVELMVGLAIAALLVVLALPSYSVWIADAQIRNAAESIASGLRWAQSQAVARNSTVEFIVDPTAGTGGWRARLVIDGSILQTAVFAEGADRTTITTVPAAARTVTFTSLGVISATNADGSAVLTQVQVDTATGVAGARNLNVLVGGGASGVPGQAARTGIKICDPKWPATDPKGCPA
jgi:type IV fimbrial biogenesis protein FimT